MPMRSTWDPLPLLAQTMLERGLPVLDCWRLPGGGVCIRWSEPKPDEHLKELAQYLAGTDDAFHVGPAYHVGPQHGAPE